MNENLKPVKELTPFTKMIMTIGTLPSSFYASMSYYESMVWLYEYLKNTVIPTVNNNADAVEELQTAFTELENYIEHYFDSLDIQEEVNTRLDEMALDGTLERIINEELFDSLNDEIEKKVNIYNQDSTLNRLYRLITTYTHVGAIHIFDNKIYLSIDNGTSSLLYKLNRETYSIESSAEFAYVIKDITNYNNSILLFNNSNYIYSIDKDTLLGIGSITTEFNLKYCEYNETDELYYLVDEDNNFLTTSNFTTISDYSFNKNCNGIVIKNDELYLLYDNKLECYNNKILIRIYNNELCVNNSYYKGKNGAICLENEKFIIGTYKWLVVHETDYIISLYEMYLSKNVENIKTLLDYNATSNDFEVHVNTSNTSVNPDGTTLNAFPNFYEAMEVILNGSYHKGAIIFDSSNDTLNDILITSSYKKISINFNGATINGMRVRNCSKIELTNATFTDQYKDEGSCLDIVNSDVTIAADCSFVNSLSLSQVLSASYNSKVNCLIGTSALGIKSSSGAIVSTRNNSIYDKKIMGDRFGNFLPNICEITGISNLVVGTDYTITNLNYFTFLAFRINTTGQMSMLEIPALDGTYNLTSCATYNSKLYIGNLNVTISGTTLTVNSRTLYNITDGALDTTSTFRINNVFGKC